MKKSTRCWYLNYEEYKRFSSLIIFSLNIESVAVLEIVGLGAENICGALIWIFINQNYSLSCLLP